MSSLSENIEILRKSLYDRHRNHPQKEENKYSKHSNIKKNAKIIESLLHHQQQCEHHQQQRKQKSSQDKEMNRDVYNVEILISRIANSSKARHSNSLKVDKKKKKDWFNLPSSSTFLPSDGGISKQHDMFYSSSPSPWIFKNNKNTEKERSYNSFSSSSIEDIPRNAFVPLLPPPPPPHSLRKGENMEEYVRNQCTKLLCFDKEKEKTKGMIYLLVLLSNPKDQCIDFSYCGEKNTQEKENEKSMWEESRIEGKEEKFISSLFHSDINSQQHYQPQFQEDDEKECILSSQNKKDLFGALLRPLNISSSSCTLENNEHSDKSNAERKYKEMNMKISLPPMPSSTERSLFHPTSLEEESLCPFRSYQQRTLQLQREQDFQKQQRKESIFVQKKKDINFNQERNDDPLHIGESMKSIPQGRAIEEKMWNYAIMACCGIPSQCFKIITEKGTVLLEERKIMKPQKSRLSSLYTPASIIQDFCSMGTNYLYLQDLLMSHSKGGLTSLLSNSMTSTIQAWMSAIQSYIDQYRVLLLQKLDDGDLGHHYQSDAQCKMKRKSSIQLHYEVEKLRIEIGVLARLSRQFSNEVLPFRIGDEYPWQKGRRQPKHLLDVLGEYIQKEQLMPSDDYIVNEWRTIVNMEDRLTIYNEKEERPSLLSSIKKNYNDHHASFTFWISLDLFHKSSRILLENVSHWIFLGSNNSCVAENESDTKEEEGNNEQPSRSQCLILLRISHLIQALSKNTHHNKDIKSESTYQKDIKALQNQLPSFLGSMVLPLYKTKCYLDLIRFMDLETYKALVSPLSLSAVDDGHRDNCSISIPQLEFSIFPCNVRMIQKRQIQMHLNFEQITQKLLVDCEKKNEDESFNSYDCSTGNSSFLLSDAIDEKALVVELNSAADAKSTERENVASKTQRCKEECNIFDNKNRMVNSSTDRQKSQDSKAVSHENSSEDTVTDPSITVRSRTSNGIGESQLQSSPQENSTNSGYDCEKYESKENELTDNIINQELTIAAKAALQEKYLELMRRAEHREFAAAWRRDRLRRQSTEKTKASLAALLASEGVDILDHQYRSTTDCVVSEEKHKAVDEDTMKGSALQVDISAETIVNEEKNDDVAIITEETSMIHQVENKNPSATESSLLSSSFISSKEEAIAVVDRPTTDPNISVLPATAERSFLKQPENSKTGSTALVPDQNIVENDEIMVGKEKQESGIAFASEGEKVHPKLFIASERVAVSPKIELSSKTSRTNEGPDVTKSYEGRGEQNITHSESKSVVIYPSMSNEYEKQEKPYMLVPNSEANVSDTKSNAFSFEVGAGQLMRFWKNDENNERMDVPSQYQVTRHHNIANFYTDDNGSDNIYSSKEECKHTMDLAVDYDRNHLSNVEADLLLPFHDAWAKCIHVQILDQCKIVEDFALHYFLQRSRLSNHFILLRHLMLGLGSYMQHFVSSLLSFMVLERDRRKDHLMDTDLSRWGTVVGGCHQLSSSLSIRGDLLEDFNMSFSYHVEGCCNEIDVDPFRKDALDFLHTDYDPPSLLSLIIDKHVMDKYRKLQAFILRHIHMENVIKRLWLVLVKDREKKLQEEKKKMGCYNIFHHKIKHISAILSQYIRVKLHKSWETFLSVLCGEKENRELGLRSMHSLYLLQHEDLDWLMCAFFQSDHVISSRVRSHLEEYYSIAYSISRHVLSGPSIVKNQFEENDNDHSIEIMEYEKRFTAFMKRLKYCLHAESCVGTKSSEHCGDLLQLLFYGTNVEDT